jgi:hypothetical protein
MITWFSLLLLLLLLLLSFRHMLTTALATAWRSP